MFTASSALNGDGIVSACASIVSVELVVEVGEVVRPPVVATAVRVGPVDQALHIVYGIGWNRSNSGRGPHRSKHLLCFVL